MTLSQATSKKVGKINNQKLSCASLPGRPLGTECRRLGRGAHTRGLDAPLIPRPSGRRT